jgi:uncharacterized double-CXXCG motif protein
MNMARVYEIRPDQARWGKLNSIEATRFRKLPGVRCPQCGAWALTGVIYPSIDPSVLNGISLPDTPAPIPVEQFARLAAVVQPLLGTTRPVRPGAELGPLKGTAEGSFGDFAWVNPWTPLLRESVWLALKEAGIRLVGMRAELDFGTHPHEPLVELEALPRVMLSNALVPEKCAVCGRLPVTKPDNLSVVAPSLDGSIPLQRIAELPTVLVANESLAQFIQARTLRDVVLTPIEAV